MVKRYVIRNEDTAEPTYRSFGYWTRSVEDACFWPTPEDAEGLATALRLDNRERHNKEVRTRVVPVELSVSVDPAQCGIINC